MSLHTTNTDLEQEPATNVSPDTHNGGEKHLSFWTSPDLSNIIFLAGLALCLAGFALLITGAVLIAKARRIQRQCKQMQTKKNFRVSNDEIRVPSQCGEAKEPSIRGSKAKVFQQEHFEQVHSLGPDYLGVGQKDTTLTSHTSWSGSMRKDQTDPDQQHCTQMESSLPAACSGPKAKPYACNPIPDPEQTSHYDQFTRQMSSTAVVSSYPMDIMQATVPPRRSYYNQSASPLPPPPAPPSSLAPPSEPMQEVMGQTPVNVNEPHPSTLGMMMQDTQFIPEDHSHHEGQRYYESQGQHEGQGYYESQGHNGGQGYSGGYNRYESSLDREASMSRNVHL